MASGGYDGCINWYKFDKDKKAILKTHSIEGFAGCINSMKFSHVRGTQTYTDNIALAVSHSQEERFGRWHVQTKAKTGISIVRRDIV